MKSAVVEIQPTERGDEMSWWFFHKGKFHPAGYLEKKLGFTVPLTDAITALVDVCKSIDPLCEATLHARSGFLFPDFVIKIVSNIFTIEVEKKFAGGASRERVFNYKVVIVIFSQEVEVINRIIKNYRRCGPRPLSMFLNI